MPQEALTPSMGAMSRSYSARSGGLASEFCLLGREEVPSLLGDTVPLNKLVMLWQLLGRQDKGRNQAHPPSLWLPAGPRDMSANSSSCLSLAGYCRTTPSSVHNSMHLCGVIYITEHPRVLVLNGATVLSSTRPGKGQCSRRGTQHPVPMNLQPKARVHWPDPARLRQGPYASQGCPEHC